MSLNENIAKFRTDHGETQSQLADILGVSNRTVSKWECGDGEPDLITLMKIAEHYKLSLDDLCGFEPERPMNKRPVASVVPDTFLKLYGIVDELHEIFAAANWTESQNASMTVPPYVLDRDGKLYDIAATGLYAGGTWAGVVNSPESNLVVALFRNKENFAWLRDRADDLTSVFAWLTDADILKFLYATLSGTLPHGFTAEYAAEHLGIPAEKIHGFLKFSRTISHEAELLDGTVTVYEGVDANFAGMWLAMLSIGYEFLREGSCSGGYYKSDYHPIAPENEQELI